MERIVFKKSILNRLVEESISSPLEKIYIGLGYKGNSEVLVEVVEECPNIAENPYVSFKADPICLYNVLTRSERRGLQLVVLIHSHPASPKPSYLDLEGMKTWRYPWLIIDSRSGEYAAWILVDGGVKRVEVVLVN